MKKYFVSMSLFFLLLLFAGCISVDYNGKEFEPVSKAELLKGSKVPEGYEVIGKAVAKGHSEEFSRGEIEKKLLSKAASVGADAVIVVMFEELPRGKISDSEFLNTSVPVDSWALDDNFEGNVQEENMSLDSGGRHERRETTIYESVMKALFLRKKK